MGRLRNLSMVGVAIAGVGSSGVSGAGEVEWIEATSPHFRLILDRDQAPRGHIARCLESLYGFFWELTPDRCTFDARRTLVYVFDGQESFDRWNRGPRDARVGPLGQVVVLPEIITISVGPSPTEEPCKAVTAQYTEVVAGEAFSGAILSLLRREQASNRCDARISPS